MKAKFYFVQALTLVRVPLIFVFLAVSVFVRQPLSDLWFAVAFGAMILSAITDLFDGYFARKFKVSSRLGSYADPMTDKVFYLTAFPTLVYLACIVGQDTHARLLLLLAVLFLLRDQWVSFLRAIGALHNLDAKANWSGKARTIISFPTICVVAARHSDVVSELRRAYEEWWKGLEPVFDETVRIGIGSPAESPTALSSHDWRTAGDAQVVWNARQVHSLHPGNGYWALDVVRGGRYEVELRRWPRPSLVVLEASHARLALGGVEQAQAISPYDDSASFQVELAPGPTTLQTWLTTADGKTRGAYFVYVSRLD